jgi:beta-phosphoglucomutase-like phosphatase (HAD superfamily)
MKFEAVLFDCDGVLVDSEPITNGVLRDMLAEQGWQMTVQECFATFVGHGITDQAPLIEKHTGKPLTEEWLTLFRARRDEALHARLQAVPNIHFAVKTLHTSTGARVAVASGADHGKVMLQLTTSTGARVAVASGADHGKVMLQLTKVGLLNYFEGRAFSGMEQPRNKPHPDVYLAAAKALDVPIERCAVIEDTPNGALAGVASGATVFGYVPLGEYHATAAALQAVGVQRFFKDMADLPALLGH